MTTQFGAAWTSEPCETFKLIKELADATDCGYVTVPELHEEPDGAKIQLAVMRIRGIGDNPAADPLFMEQGGPGGTTIGFFPSRGQLPKLVEILNQRDIVLVEQRGTQYSKPFLECPERIDYNIAVAKGEIPDDDSYITACKERLDKLANLSAFNTKQNAADMYAVAKALGYEQFNYYGVSYGTLLGQYVLNQSADHPGMLRSVILDSVVPIDIDDDAIKDQTASSAIRNFFKACEADAVCNRDFPDLESRVLGFADELNANPQAITLTLQDGSTISSTFKGTDLMTMIFGDLYALPLIQQLPAKLDKLIRTRDFSEMEKSQSAGLTSSALAEGMHLAMKCPRRGAYPEYTQNLFEPAYPQVDLAKPAAGSYDRRCAVLDVARAGADEFEIRVTDIPVLLLNGIMDPATPPAYGEHTAKKLETAYNYTLPDVGHNVMLGSKATCALGIAAAFLSDPTQAPDSACIADLKPFFYGRITPVDELTLQERDLGNGLRVQAPAQWAEVKPGTFQDPNDPINGSTGLVVFGTEDAESPEAMILKLDPHATIVSRDVKRGNYAWTVAESQLAPGKELVIAAAPLPDGKRVATIKLLMPPDNAPAIITALLNPLLSGVKVTGFSEAWTAEPCETFDLSKELAELSDCGYVTVPLRHGEANTQTIQLGVVRIRSIAEQPAPDPLFMEQGGPGGSTIAYFPTRTAQLAPLLQARDVVLVEQRGTKYSKPRLDCPEVADYSVAVAKGEAKLDDAYLNACRARWDEQTDVSAFNNEENAADMYAVAKALGYGQFNYYGVSYGTLLGQHVMKQAVENPGMLRSVILDSVVPLDVANIESKDQTTSNSLRSFFAACEQDAACNRNFPDLQARYLALLDDLTANPTTVTVTLPSGEKVGMPVDAAVVQRQVFNTLYSHLKTRFLPGILDTMISKRDFSWVAEQLSGGFGVGGLVEGMHLAITCPTYTNPPTDQPDVLEPAFPQVDFFDGEVESYDRRCAIMAVPGADADAYTYPTEDIPTLILNGQLDPTTPPQFGEHVGSKLKTAYVFTLPDVGHGQVPDSPTQCPVTIATAFLSNPGEAPDASCIEGLKPIFAGRVTPLDELTFETRTVLTDVVVSLPTQFVDPLGTGLFSDPTDPINQPTGFVQILVLENQSVDEALSNLKDPTVIAEDVEIGNYRWKILESTTTLPGFVFRSAATLLPDGERVLKITVGGSPARAEKIIETLMQPVLSSVQVK